MSQALLFEHYRAARARKLPAWAVPLFVACTLFTAGLLFAMWVKTIWETEQLERPKHMIDLAIAPAPPPPPPPLAGGQKPVTTIILKRPTVRTIVQPVRIEKPEERPTETNVGDDPDGDPNGELHGTGVGPGVIGSEGDPPPPQPLPEPPKPPRIVPPAALEPSR